jgi:hypothetical protein
LGKPSFGIELWHENNFTDGILPRQPIEFGVTVRDGQPKQTLTLLSFLPEATPDQRFTFRNTRSGLNGQKQINHSSFSVRVTKMMSITAFDTQFSLVG